MFYILCDHLVKFMLQVCESVCVLLFVLMWLEEVTGE